MYTYYTKIIIGSQQENVDLCKWDEKWEGIFYIIPDTEKGPPKRSSKVLYWKFMRK